MTSIGAAIREIYDASNDPVQAVQDYLSDKADRPVSRSYVLTMIRIHVTDYRRREAAYQEYMSETPLGHFYDDMAGGVE